ncbi:MAG: hypothetical protein WC686_05310 [Candidatus Shapirobacteria bacterium]|jgi:hypothetical protein
MRENHFLNHEVVTVISLNNLPEARANRPIASPEQRLAAHVFAVDLLTQQLKEDLKTNF